MSTTKSASLVLVHGTFAPNAEWTHPDSYLCTTLRIRFPSAEFFHSIGAAGIHILPGSPQGNSLVSSYGVSKPTDQTVRAM
jgi:hypothetical protein